MSVKNSFFGVYYHFQSGMPVLPVAPPGADNEVQTVRTRKINKNKGSTRGTWL